MRHLAIAIATFLSAGLSTAFVARVEDKVAVGRMFSPIGTLVVSGKEEGDWELPHLFDDIHAGRALLALPGARGIVDLKEGDVHLILAGNLPELSSSPVLETRAVLHETKSLDLDMTLQRGRIIIENHRKDGPVKVRIQTQTTDVEITLTKKGACVLESFGPVVPGISSKYGRAQRTCTLLVIRGKAEVAVKGKNYVLNGPAVLEWVGDEGPREPKALKELPAWIDPGADLSARATAWHKAVEGVRRGMAEKKSLNLGLADASKGMDPTVRSVALLSYAALGDMDKVVAGLSDGKSGDVRRAAVIGLQYNLGSANYARRLRASLIGAGLSAGQAETGLKLLQGVGEKDLGRPETYQTLIDSLQHDKLAVRELAAWQLYRLVPQGKSIPYDAAGTEEQRGRSQAAWRRLIPPGQVPPPES
jgi:hypothetical protein